MIWTGRRSAAGTVFESSVAFYQVSRLTPASGWAAPGGDYVLTVLDNHDVVSGDRLAHITQALSQRNTDPQVMRHIEWRVNRYLLQCRTVDPKAMDQRAIV